MTRVLKNKILYVSHDANFSGAQILSLNIIKELILNDFDVAIIILADGVLLEEFEKQAPVIKYWELDTEEEKIEAINDLSNKGYDRALCSTTVSGSILKLLKSSCFQVVTLIHELKTTIDEYNLDSEARDIQKYSDFVVFPTKFVKDSFLDKYVVDVHKIITLPQGDYTRHQYNSKKPFCREFLRQKLGVSEGKKIILGIGYGTLRKGVDLFVQVANQVCNKTSDAVFVWVGSIEPVLKLWVEHDVTTLDLQNNVFFLGEDIDIGKYYAAADIALLTSREDPFPTVVLGAMYTSLPIACFKDAGGATEIVTEDTGSQCDYLDISAMAAFVLSMMEDDTLRQKKGRMGSELIKQYYNFSRYVNNLTSLLGFEFKKISVVVPNYNYGELLEDRFTTINNQNYPIYEIIILDDCSSDNSDDVILEWTDKFRAPVKYIKNIKNSGSVFEQWRKGMKAAKGDYIWIAEADDLSEPGFLSGVMQGFDDTDVVLSYAQSKQIDSNADLLASNYLEYTNGIDEDHWKSSYINDGADEVAKYMSIKNTIPNVSAVVLRKLDEFDRILSKAKSYKIAGDWYFYIKALECGKVYFNADSLNLHRRHESSVTHSENNQLHYNEVIDIQSLVEPLIPEKYKNIALLKRNEYNNFLKDYLSL